MVAIISSPDPLPKRNITLQLVTPTRGGGGGLVGTSRAFEVREGARFLYSFEVPPLLTADALGLRAWLNRCAGGARVCGIRLPVEPTSTFASTTLSAEATAGDETISVASATNAFVGQHMVVGDSFDLANDPSQVCRVVSVAGTTIGIEPPVRVTTASGQPAIFGQPFGRFRMVGETPAVPLVNGRSEPVQLQFEEAI